MMPYLGENIKKLGFGLMRLPKQEDVIDIEAVKVMVDRFMEDGFTYFDTAWAYPGSEVAIREALVERYPRGSFQLATKNAAWINCKTREEAIAQFETSLKQTGAGYFDFYLLHNLGESRTKFFNDFDMWNFVQNKKAEGLIKRVGFSFHSTPEELEAILTDHPEMEFVQLQINYGDWENPAIQSRACYEVARKHGKPVIIMEPVKGGMLASPPEAVEEIFKSANPEASYASWAIRFAASQEGVITVLSGMSNLEQMKDNLSYMKDFTTLSDDEKKIIAAAQDALSKIPLIPCTSCDYCAKVCPNDIGIAGSFTAMNSLTLYGNKAMAKHQAGWLVGGHGRKPASECIKCGECEKVCPQHIAISQELVNVAEALA
ncbi:aldo/keto reductase [Acetobacterium wieringae]|nr:aldo/keto reductase [Acetobacterium wieringae]URN84249.1 aldo/keto reductase [Acetobacterium wieringae]